MELRPYQRAAVDAVYAHLRTRDDNPVVVIPTGGGKTPVIATICRDAVATWGGRVIVLAHVKELLEQAADKLRRVTPDLEVGVHSASLGRRDTRSPVIVAGIQSAYAKAASFDAFDVVLVDECHLIPPEGDGMYRRFLADARSLNPDLRVLGFTATPFRTTSGPICSEDHFLNEICFEIGVRELIRDGYLCPLVTRAGEAKVDTSGLEVRGGEFVPSEVERLVNEKDVVGRACAEIVRRTADRDSVLIFAAGVEHGLHVRDVFELDHGIECGFISADTSPTERAELLGRFRREPDGLFERPPLKYLCNVNVLTTGFDAPNVDAVALLRPTASPGLYYQMVGRGLRTHEGKQDCLVLDYGNNVIRHGPVDRMRVGPRPMGHGGASEPTGGSPGKECPGCSSLIANGYVVCPDCGHEFEDASAQHEASASQAGILSGETIDTEYEVRDVFYHEHSKKGAPEDAPKTLRVDYQLGLQHFVSEWVCFEHKGWPRRKAEQWWRKRSPDPPPDTAREAVDLCEAGAVAIPDRITVRAVVGEPFDRIVDCQLGPMPEPSPAWGEIDLEDVPF